MQVKSNDLSKAVSEVLSGLVGIDELYPNQWSLIESLFKFDNIIFTSATNSGKTLPPILYPFILKKLSHLGYKVPSTPKILFLTALNALQLSLITNIRSLGLKCDAVTNSNAKQLIKSEIMVLFISPEVLKLPEVIQELLKHRSSFVLKVIDEAHLGKEIEYICINPERSWRI